MGTSEYNAGLSLEREREGVIIAMNMKYMIYHASKLHLQDLFGIYVDVMPFSASFFLSSHTLWNNQGTELSTSLV